MGSWLLRASWGRAPRCPTQGFGPAFRQDGRSVASHHGSIGSASLPSHFLCLLTFLSLFFYPPSSYCPITFSSFLFLTPLVCPPTPPRLTGWGMYFFLLFRGLESDSSWSQVGISGKYRRQISLAGGCWALPHPSLYPLLVLRGGRGPWRLNFLSYPYEY